MSDESSATPERPVISEAIQAKLREYQAEQERKYNAAMEWLEAPSIEPEQHAAYAATLDEMMAIPINEVAWPDDSPRYKLHHAIEYGETLTQRRAEVEARFDGRQPPVAIYSIRRYALAALHAFKVWRSNPEPEGSFGKLLKDAALLRHQLRAYAACFVLSEKMRSSELQHYDGGMTVEALACDLFLLSGVLQNLPAATKENTLVTPLHLMQATVLARALLQQATRSQTAPELWQPTVLYGRAITLVDNVSLEAERVLSEFHNEERDPWEALEWKPKCLFCRCDIERLRHSRKGESARATQRRAQFVSSTLTAALRQRVIEN
jgi:hypothetical protein